jgi:hypothetical protein
VTSSSFPLPLPPMPPHSERSDENERFQFRQDLLQWRMDTYSFLRQFLVETRGHVEPDSILLDGNLVPNPARAHSRANLVVDLAARGLPRGSWPEADTWRMLAHAYALRLGYTLPPTVHAMYFCTVCEVRNVKLWRGVGDTVGICLQCLARWQGRPVPDVDADGCCASEYGSRTDQVLGSLPWVLAPDGLTWGYTSIPSNGGLWWRALPLTPQVATTSRTTPAETPSALTYAQRTRYRVHCPEGHAVWLGPNPPNISTDVGWCEECNDPTAPLDPEAPYTVVDSAGPHAPASAAPLSKEAP